MSDARENPPPLDTRWLRNLANAGRGASMTDALHQSADEIDELRAKLKALEEQKPVAWGDPENLPVPSGTSCLIYGGKGPEHWNRAPLYLAAGAKP